MNESGKSDWRGNVHFVLMFLLWLILKSHTIFASTFCLIVFLLLRVRCIIKKPMFVRSVIMWSEKEMKMDGLQGRQNNTNRDASNSWILWACWQSTCYTLWVGRRQKCPGNLSKGHLSLLLCRLPGHQWCQFWKGWPVRGT